MSDESFSKAQLAQLRQVFREEISDAGLRLDGADHVDAAREDFRFVRRLRIGVNGMAAKVGWLLIAAIVAGLLYLVNLGANVWKGLP